MAGSYEFATGSVRVRECSLLSRADLEQLIAASDEATLVAVLQDKGFGEQAAPAGTVEELLRQQMQETWTYMRSLLPDPSILNAFLLRNDLHNAKTILKGVFGDRDVSDMMLSPALLQPKDILFAVKEKDFSELPMWLAAALSEAYDVLAQSNDAQRADAVLDKAAMQAMLDAAAVTRIPLLNELVSATVFYADVKMALRAAHAHMSAEYLDVALCPCEGVLLDGWKTALQAGEEDMLALLAGITQYSCDEAIAAYRHSPASFEKWVDDYLLSLAKVGQTVTSGAEPLLGYFMGREAEDKVIRIIAVGIRTGQPAADIRERVRELYG